MTQAPTIWTLRGLFDHAQTVSRSVDRKHWQPARPTGLDTIPHRLRAAWLVFTGRADAVTWPEDRP